MISKIMSKSERCARRLAGRRVELLDGLVGRIVGYNFNSLCLEPDDGGWPISTARNLNLVVPSAERGHWIEYGATFVVIDDPVCKKVEKKAKPQQPEQSTADNEATRPIVEGSVWRRRDSDRLWKVQAVTRENVSVFELDSPNSSIIHRWDGPIFVLRNACVHVSDPDDITITLPSLADLERTPEPPSRKASERAKLGHAVGATGATGQNMVSASSAPIEDSSGNVSQANVPDRYGHCDGMTAKEKADQDAITREMMKPLPEPQRTKAPINPFADVAQPRLGLWWRR